jgi:phospholipase/carboxylesterase
MRASPHDPHGGQPVLHRGEPLDSAKGAAVLLHGRGASGEDILGLAAEFDLSDIAYFAPQAARNTWYPNSFLAPINQNQPWLDSALNLVGAVLDRIVVAGLDRRHVALVGFSQGACLATEFVARRAHRYGALIAFTGGLIGPPGTKFSYSGDLAGTPCFLGAGDPDLHVPWKRVEESAAVLTALGGTAILRRYSGLGHTINQDEMTEGKLLLSGLRSLT